MSQSVPTVLDALVCVFSLIRLHLDEDGVLDEDEPCHSCVQLGISGKVRAVFVRWDVLADSGEERLFWGCRGRAWESDADSEFTTSLLAQIAEESALDNRREVDLESIVAAKVCVRVSYLVNPRIVELGEKWSLFQPIDTRSAGNSLRVSCHVAGHEKVGYVLHHDILELSAPNLEEKAICLALAKAGVDCFNFHIGSGSPTAEFFALGVVLTIFDTMSFESTLAELLM